MTVKCHSKGVGENNISVCDKGEGEVHAAGHTFCKFVAGLVKVATDTGKMLPESGFLFMEPKKELLELTGGKHVKVFITGKQIAPSTDTGRGRKSPPSLIF